MYLDQNQEANFHLELAQSEEQLKDQGGRETAAEEARVASAPGVAVASASDAAF